ncbi:hypothetical protein D3C81_891680 [compost metagenome]
MWFDLTATDQTHAGQCRGIDDASDGAEKPGEPGHHQCAGNQIAQYAERRSVLGKTRPQPRAEAVIQQPMGVRQFVRQPVDARSDHAKHDC